MRKRRNTDSPPAALHGQRRRTQPTVRALHYSPLVIANAAQRVAQCNRVVVIAPGVSLASGTLALLIVKTE